MSRDECADAEPSAVTANRARIIPPYGVCLNYVRETAMIDARIEYAASEMPGAARRDSRELGIE